MAVVRVLALMVVMCGSVVADEGLEVEIGLMTHHWITKGLNEDNRLVGVHYRGVEAASFVNSFGDQSYLLGGRYDLPHNFSISAGLIDGYGSNSKWFPVRIDDTVAYASLNYTLPVSDVVRVRFRQMGKSFLVSIILR